MVEGILATEAVVVALWIIEKLELYVSCVESQGMLQSNASNDLMSSLLG